MYKIKWLVFCGIILFKLKDKEVFIKDEIGKLMVVLIVFIEFINYLK